ncbi:MAG TPA: hypothetical protein V6D19_04175 [Stenomitos sp.]
MLLFNLLPHFAQIDISGQAQDFAANAIAASQAIHRAVNNLWSSVQQGGTYRGLCIVGANLSLATMLFFIYKWHKKVLEDKSFSWEPITDFIWPLIVIFLLVTNPGHPDGKALWSLTLGIRSVINNADQIVLTSASSTANLAQSRAAAAQNVAFEATIKGIATTCNGQATPADKKACWDKNRDIVIHLINGTQSNPWFDGLTSLFDKAYEVATNPNGAAADALVAAGNLWENAIASVIKGIVLALGMAFSYLLELALLLTAMLGPIAVGASLLPIPTKPILAWITSMFSIGIAKISFSIITGMMSDVMLNAPPSDSMAYIIFTGVLSPILALLLAGGGGLAVFSGLSAGAGMVLGGVAYANNYARNYRVQKQSRPRQKAA